MKFYIEYCDIVAFVQDIDEQGPLYTLDVYDALDVQDPVLEFYLMQTGHNSYEKEQVYTRELH